MDKKPYALRKKLLVWLLVPLLLLFVARAGNNYYYSAKLSNEIYDRELYALAMSLQPQIAFVGGKPVVNLSRSAHDILLFDQYDLLYFVVRDAQGKVIAGNESIPSPPQWLSRANNYYFYNGWVSNKKVRIVAVRAFGLMGQQHQSIMIEAAETTNKRDILAREIISSNLITQAFIIIIAAAVVWFGVGKGLTPLRRLQVAVANRSHLDLSPIEYRDVPEEVSPLILSINDLMRRLGRVLDSQNRFIADAAHQLRTPLSGLVVQVGVALRQNDPETSRHCMEKLYVSAERITRLANQLLALARNEPGIDRILVEEWIDINQLASETVMEWVPEALKKNIDLGFEGEDHPVNILGDAPRLKEMISNLVDNALRYTQSAGRVTVRVLNKGVTALVFEDNGPGIPPEERERVFERFYRVMGNEADGSGLGLAIVRDIARAHNADVSLAGNPAGRGLVVRVIFWRGSA